MADLLTTATIRLVDQLTGPLKGVASRVQATAAQLGKIPGALQNAVMAPHMLGTGLLGGFLVHKEYEYDKLKTRFRAITELSDEEMGKLQNQMNAVGVKTAISRQELLEGALAWKEAGGSLEDYTRSLENYAKVARITHTSVKDVALESRGLMLAFGEDVSNPEQVKKMEEFFLVASKNIKGGAHALIEAMKNAAPIAAKLHITKEELAALISVGVAEGFQPGEIGRGLKTVPMRLMAPSKDALAQMRAANIDMVKLYGLDLEKTRDTSPLERALAGSGLKITEAAKNVLTRQLTKADFTQGLGPVQDKLTQDLATALGVPKGDARNRAIIAKAVDNHFKRTSKGLSLEELFKAQDLSLAELTPIFGKEHAAKIIATLRQKGLFDKIREQILKESPGAIDRKAEIALQGFSFQLDRLGVALTTLLGTVAGSGVTKDLASFFDRLTTGILKLGTVNPNVFRALAYGLGALIALPVAGLIIGQAAVAVRALGAAALIASGGLARLLVGAGALAAAPFLAMARGATAAALGLGILGSRAAVIASFVPAFLRFAGVLARISAIGAIVGGGIYAYQNFDKIVAFFERLAATPEAKGLVDSMSKLWETTKQLGANLDDALKAILKLFGAEPGENSGLFTALTKLIGFLDTIVNLTRLGIEGINSIFETKEEREAREKAKGESPFARKNAEDLRRAGEPLLQELLRQKLAPPQSIPGIGNLLNLNLPKQVVDVNVKVDVKAHNADAKVDVDTKTRLGTNADAVPVTTGNARERGVR